MNGWSILDRTIKDVIPESSFNYFGSKIPFLPEDKGYSIIKAVGTARTWILL